MSFTESCPELAEKSPLLSVENEEGELAHFQLTKFETVKLPDDPTSFMAYVGGPAWSCAWHPDGSHLALSAHRVAQPVHRVTGLYSGRGHIQIWRAEQDALQLVMLAPHDGDTAWDLAWRPVLPEKPIHTLAAALADGQLIVYHFQSFTAFTSVFQSVALRSVHALSDGVRAVSWAPDAQRLASGTAAGCIEIWLVNEPDDPNAAPMLQMISRVRVHDFAVSQIRWFHSFVHGSVGHDGALRIRDVRVPSHDLEAVLDGLAWNLCITPVEEDTVIAGTDHGFLKLAKLGALGQISSTEMKKKRIQTGSLRDIVSMQVGTNRTALFSAGAEGTVLCGLMPRPLWTGKSGKAACRSGRYVQVPVLQWSAQPWVPLPPDNHEYVTPPSSYVEPPPEAVDKLQVVSNDLYEMRSCPMLLRLEASLHTSTTEQMLNRTAAKVRINVPSDVHLCAAEYDQRALIPRLALAENTRLLAVPNYAGLLIVMHVTDDMLMLDRPDAGAASMSRHARAGQRKATGKNSSSTAQPKTPRKKKKIVDLVKPKKRGRPRKYPYPESVREARCVVESIICNVLGEPFDESTVVAPRRGNLPAMVVKNHQEKPSPNKCEAHQSPTLPLKPPAARDDSGVRRSRRKRGTRIMPDMVAMDSDSEDEEEADDRKDDPDEEIDLQMEDSENEQTVRQLEDVIEDFEKEANEQMLDVSEKVRTKVGTKKRKRKGKITMKSVAVAATEENNEIRVPLVLPLNNEAYMSRAQHKRRRKQ